MGVQHIVRHGAFAIETPRSQSISLPWLGFAASLAEPVCYKIHPLQKAVARAQLQLAHRIQ
jgi:hypothetical protein